MRRLRGSILLFFAIVAVSLALYYYQDARQERSRGEASALGGTKGTVKVGIDPYAGYFVMRSTGFRDQLLSSGYGLSLLDDGGDYQLRARRLARGDLDVAVFTVDSLVLNGRAEDYPGSIVAVLSESLGSDALVSNIQEVGSLDDLKNGSDWRIAYTANSPSHHLLKAVSVDFGLKGLSRNGRWQVPLSSSGEALERLLEGQVELAVLWEPDLSEALADSRFAPLIGSESSPGLIVDVLVARHDFIRDQPEVLREFLDTYFEVLQEFRVSRDALESQIARDGKFSDERAAAIVSGIEWKSLFENAAFWYGVSIDGNKPAYRLYDAIERAVQVLQEYGDFKYSPLPQGDPRSLIYGDFVQAIFRERGKEANDVENYEQRDFTPLTADKWERLPKVGTLKLRPISFQAGAFDLNEEGVQSLEEMVSLLDSYPEFRVLVSGHTSDRGVPEANLVLSQRRAEAVVSFLVSRYGVDGDRLRAVGLGGEMPLRRIAGESYRAHQNRLSRVEFQFLRNLY